MTRATQPRTLEGTCRCGAVAYEVADEFDFAVYCHCSLCRRATGAAFKTIAGIAAEKLRIAVGQAHILRVAAPTWHEERCSLCGSLLFAAVRDGAYLRVAMGTLRDDPAVRPTAHIFVGSKATWFDIADDLPQYASALP